MKTNAIIRIVIYALVILILLGILCACLGIGVLTIDLGLGSSGTYVEGEASVSAGQIRDLEIEWASGSIRIVTADTDTITFSESGQSNEQYRMTYEQSDDTLHLSYGSSQGIQIGLVSIPSKDLTITVPKDWVCGELEIDAASVDISISGLTVTKLDLDGASNQLTFSGSVEKLDCDGASNDIELICSNNPSQIDMDGASCDLDLTLPQGCGFRAELDGLSCDFYSALDYKTTNGCHSYGDESCRVNVDGVSCNVTIRESETQPQSTQHSVACFNDYTKELIIEPLAESYGAGTLVTVKTHILLDTDLHLYVNGAYICDQTAIAENGEYTHWEFTFTMPDHDVTIQLKNGE